MFGEEPLIGTSIASLDIKGRIILPSFTKREKGDKLVLVHDSIDGYVKIYRYDTVEEKVENLSKQVESAKTKEDKIVFLKELREYCKSLNSPAIVSSQGRFTLSDKSKLFGDKVSVTGCYDHVVIESAEKKK